ncbi:MAG: hypothetical protein E2O99_00310, partial [Acidobacteria bacterium]
MRFTKPLVLVAALALVVAACSPSTSTDTTEAATATTEAAPDTTQPAADTTTSEAMAGLVFDVGFDEATGTIKVGALAAITGPIAGIGASLLDGHKVYWEKVNANGGVAGM